MVRVMELIKEYLSIDETISYLKGNRVIQADFDFLQDLERERKLTPLIYLQTNFLTNENLFLSNGKPKYYRLTGYFKPTDFILLDCYGYDERYCENRLFLYGMGGSFKVEKIIFSDTTDYLMDKTGQLCGFSRDEKAPDFFVSIYEFDLNCIRFKKTDLENLFYLQSQTDNNEILETLKKQDRHIKALIDKGEDYDLLVGRLESLTQQLQQLKAENKKLQEQLEQQANQPSNKAADNDLFAKILDESNENHAIDLKYAINLWLDLYVINPRAHGEHSGNADTWLKKNTEYSELKGGDGSIKRIREIATPLKKFGSTRPKENQK